jgi:GT2 family glycosyltransferase
VTAPVALFVYNRPGHTRQTVEALVANAVANQTPLHVFSDAPRNESASLAVAEVRSYIRNIAGFKSVTIIERETNFGLARSIIDGVTRLCDEYGRVIVVEDDLLVAPGFLTFMNDALEKYALEERVMQISGYMFPARLGVGHKGLFLNFPTSWGWATWKRAWDKFDFTAQGYSVLKSDPEMIKAFNLNGRYDYFSMLQRYLSGRAQSWAIRWHLTVFMRKGLVLFPSETLVENIGFDGSGVNCVVSSIGQSAVPRVNQRFDLPDEIELSELYQDVIDAIPQKKVTPAALVRFVANKLRSRH